MDLSPASVQIVLQDDRRRGGIELGLALAPIGFARASRDSASWLDRRSSCSTTGTASCASTARANASTNFV
jgi:hypothetical protein